MKSLDVVYIPFFNCTTHRECDTWGSFEGASLCIVNWHWLGPSLNVKGNIDPKAKKGELRATFIAPKHRGRRGGQGLCVGGFGGLAGNWRQVAHVLTTPAGA